MPWIEGAPPIANYDEDLITREELAAKFKVTPVTVDHWRYGRGGTMPPMPYIRLGNTMYFSKVQIVWWLNQYQQQPDPYFIERMRRLKEGIKVGKPKKR